MIGEGEEAAAPVLAGDLHAAIRKEYSATMADGMLRMLQAINVLIWVYKIIKEPTPTPESRDDVALATGSRWLS